MQFSFRRPVLLCPWPLSCPESELQPVVSVAEEGERVNNGQVAAATDYCFSFPTVHDSVRVQATLVNVRKYHVRHEKVHRIELLDLEEDDEEEEEEDWDHYDRYHRCSYEDRRHSSKRDIVISEQSHHAMEDGVTGLEVAIFR